MGAWGISPKILLVEDSEIDQQVILGILGKQNSVTVTASIAGAAKALEAGHFDLVLLDVDLPDGNGFRFFAQLQAEERTRGIPVIFLTAKRETPDEVMGFSLGAEDYIAKPVDPVKLRARLEAWLRRLQKGGGEAALVKGALKVDFVKQRAFRLGKAGEESLDLTPLEFRILAQFSRQEDRVYSREQIIDSVWGMGVHVVDRIVDMHVSNLRKKLAGTGYTMRSVRGVGYRFTREREA
jgi:two-component system phosphate regulon response regulator PhoB